MSELPDGVYPTPKSNCPKCGYKMDACSSLDSTRAPRNGDITLCSKCAACLVFQEDLTLRFCTTDDLDRIDPLQVLTIHKAQKTIMKFNWIHRHAQN